MDLVVFIGSQKALPDYASKLAFYAHSNANSSSFFDQKKAQVTLNCIATYIDDTLMYVFFFEKHSCKIPVFY